MSTDINAIEKILNERGDAIVNEAAVELREAISKFERACGLNPIWTSSTPDSIVRKRAKKLVLQLAEHVCTEDGYRNVNFVIPTEYWEAARRRARLNFFTQFEDLRRFMDNHLDLDSTITRESDTTP